MLPKLDQEDIRICNVLHRKIDQMLFSIFDISCNSG